MPRWVKKLFGRKSRVKAELDEFRASGGVAIMLIWPNDALQISRFDPDNIRLAIAVHEAKMLEKLNRDRAEIEKNRFRRLPFGLEG